jgi:hypothetical protein
MLHSPARCLWIVGPRCQSILFPRASDSVELGAPARDAGAVAGTRNRPWEAIKKWAKDQRPSSPPNLAVVSTKGEERKCVGRRCCGIRLGTVSGSNSCRGGVRRLVDCIHFSTIGRARQWTEGNFTSESACRHESTYYRGQRFIASNFRWVPLR